MLVDLTDAHITYKIKKKKKNLTHTFSIRARILVREDKVKIKGKINFKIFN